MCPSIHAWIWCPTLNICLISDITFVDWDTLQSFTKMRPLHKQCQSPSIQCTSIRYPRSSEHPLIQFSLFTGGQVETLNGLFHGQTGHLPSMANTEAPERQIFNWPTSEWQRQYHYFSPQIRLLFSRIHSLMFTLNGFGLWSSIRVSNVSLFCFYIFKLVFLPSVNMPPWMSIKYRSAIPAKLLLTSFDLNLWKVNMTTMYGHLY